MRKVKLENWRDKPSSSPEGEGRKKKRKPRRRPTPCWKLSDSIIYIKTRDRYLRKKGVLKKIGERKWRLNI